VETPGQLLVNDIASNRKWVMRMETSVAEETLGFFLAPSGDTNRQAENMEEKAMSWVEQMAAGKLAKMEAWTMLQTTTWRKLSYPLPALNLTKYNVKTLWPSFSGMCFLLSEYVGTFLGV